MKKFKNTIIVIMTSTFLISCVNDSFDIPKQDICVPPVHKVNNVEVLVAKNKEISNVWSSAPTSVLGVKYIADDIVEGYVISSEEGGNFYKSMYIQPLDGTKGLNLSIDSGDLYNKKFEPGRKVYLKLKGLAYTNPTNYARGLIFGDLPTGIYAVDRLSIYTYKNYLYSSCDVVSEETYVKKFTTIAAVKNDMYLNNLVEISGVQFLAECGSYSSKLSDTSLRINNGIVANNTIDVRTSRYSNFAGETIPYGYGTIRGVLTKYGSTYQIILRTQRDVKMTNPRLKVPTPPVGGNAIVYSGNFSENFTSYTAPTYAVALPKYINQVEIGPKYWDLTTNGINQCLQTSAFNFGCVKNYFIVPVDMTAANNFSFKTKDGFYNGQPLKVYYTTTFVPGGTIKQSDLKNITSQFVFSQGSASGYAPSFTSSGVFEIPTYVTGNGYFIFEYDGTSGVTTTMQLDDILVN